jgi:molybdopterin-guanine dinucleotide biosynthesis protein A
MIEPRDVAGVVLAGGQGRRMGGVDKGLVELAGRPMIAHVLERFRPQVGAVVINANQNVERYSTFGVPVVRDGLGGFAGPLAGLQSALAQTTKRYLCMVPCDSPFVPPDLVARLAIALERDRADLAVARTFDQPHPVFALMRRDVLPGLTAFLDAGGRKIDAWYAALAVTEVAFDDEADAFRNVNTRSELLELERSRDR